MVFVRVSQWLLRPKGFISDGVQKGNEARSEDN